MGKVFQSIEDIIQDSQGTGGDSDDSVQTKFKEKQAAIKKNEIERMTKSKAASLGMPYINLVGFPISPEAISIMSEQDAEKLSTICFYYDGVNIGFATTNPSGEIAQFVNGIAEEYHADCKLYLISQYSLLYAIYFYKSLPKITPPIKGVKITEEELQKYSGKLSSFNKLQEEINDASITEVVTMLIASAIQVNASDIHIEGEEKGVKARFRIDGVLHDAALIEREKWPKIISRMKLLARVKINVTDKPQDGRYSIFLTNKRIDVRSSFLPTSFGESVVMRLLDSSAVGVSFSDLGLLPQAFDILAKEIAKPNGMVLTTGPTGSGKTTTLYAILRKLNQPETKIVTLEDPIEYQLEGINQSQIDASKNYTFASGLRSILRQDPDVVMVGEIRDLETAETSIQAGLTGHLVLSTLHTNDASGVIPRLLDMGVKPYFLTPAINCLIGQRLVRKLCDQCKVEHVLTEPEDAQVKKILGVISPKAGVSVPTTLPKIYKAGPGCEHCNGLSYKGRIGIYEIFTMTNEIKQLTSDQAPAFKILEQAIEGGMVTMLQDGVLKCLSGVTSLEEVYRVIGKFDYIDALYDIVVSQVIGRGVKLTDAELKMGEELSKDMVAANEKVNQLKVEEVLNAVLAAAVHARVNDIHIEPTEDGVKIRFRIDGVLYILASLEAGQYLPMLSKIKILSGFPTNIKKASWDGRFSIVVPSQKIDCRISIISGGYGETVVIRLLTSQVNVVSLEELGIRPYTVEKIKTSISRTKGVVLNTGPTGSGKTTTLYTILNILNQPSVKIITVEDPIEYHLEGIMQTQVDPVSGYSFAIALRSLLRQNPNVIMIGEIRDDETAQIAIESAMTGHLVLSTVHTNNAAGVMPRMIGFGITKQLLAGSVNCMIGQRLVRRICPNCKTEDNLPKETADKVQGIIASLPEHPDIVIPEKTIFYKGAGCDQCGNLGYKGRVGIYEAISMTAEMQKLIQGEGVTEQDIEKLAIEQGTVLMAQDGILKALAGETSAEEVFRVAE